MYESKEALQERIDEYFDYIKGEKADDDLLGDEDSVEAMLRPVMWIRSPEPATITGLALFLGFCSRQSFYDYEKKRKFAYTIKRARLKVEQEYEKKLTTSSSPTGSIFALKNLGWKDKTETEHSGEVGVRQITGIEVK